MINCKRCSLEITSQENKRAKGICPACDLRAFAADPNSGAKIFYALDAEPGDPPLQTLKPITRNGRAAYRIFRYGKDEVKEEIIESYAEAKLAFVAFAAGYLGIKTPRLSVKDRYP